MPKIFRGTTPTPQPPSSPDPSSQDGRSLSKSGEPGRRKYSTKSQYKSYETREDPIQSPGNNASGRLAAFKAKLRSRREKKSSVSGSGLFSSKLDVRLDILKERASRAEAVIMDNRHKLEQAKARENLITRHFGKDQSKWVSKKEYEQKISQLKKDAPWMSSIQRRQQAEADAKALEQLRGGN